MKPVLIFSAPMPLQDRHCKALEDTIAAKLKAAGHHAAVIVVEGGMGLCAVLEGDAEESDDPQGPGGVLGERSSSDQPVGEPD